MTAGRSTAHLLAPTIALLAAASASTARAAEEPLPLPIAVEVKDEGRVAADRSLRLLELAMIDEVRRAQCARETLKESDAEATTPRLVLRVLVHDVLQEASWGMGTAGRAEAVQGGAMHDPVAAPSVRVRGECEIVLQPECVRLKTRRFAVEAGGGAADARSISPDSVRDDAIARVAAEARKTLCGSRAKLRRQIDRAKRDAGTSRPPS